MKERPILFSGAMVRRVLDGTKTQTRRLAPVTDLKIHPPYDGRKVTTWSVHFDKAQRGILSSHSGAMVSVAQVHNIIGNEFCRYGSVGSRLWVRESWCPDPPDVDGWGYAAWSGCKEGKIAGVPEQFRKPEHVIYAADWDGPGMRWTPSIHMPRWASRILLEVTEVRLERLQDISDADAIAEGARRFSDIPLARPMANPNRWSMESPANTDECLSTARWAFANYFCKLGDNKGGVIDSRVWDANPYVWAVSFKRIEQ